jgi:periplasmic protein CpxP/Spy
MKSKPFRILGAATLMAGLTFAQTTTPGTAAPATGVGHPVARRMMHRMANYLQLTDAQKAQAKTIFQTARENGQPLRAQLQPLRAQLKAAILAGNNAQIDQITASMGPIQAQLAANRAKAFAQFYATLTPDQQAKAQSGMNRFMSGHVRGARFHRGGNPPAGGE